MRQENKYDNERLEYLGDAVLDLVTADILFRNYPYESEGVLTEMRSRIVNATFLGDMAIKLGIDKMLRYDTRNRSIIQRNKSVYADALEALIGAIYVDLGYSAAHDFVSKRLVKLYVDFDTIKTTVTNYKSKVIEWSQKNNVPIAFEVIETIPGDYNKKQFVVALLVNQEQVAKGIEYTKKQAEQNAAAKFFETIKEKEQNP